MAESSHAHQKELLGDETSPLSEMCYENANTNCKQILEEYRVFKWEKKVDKFKENQQSLSISPMVNYSMIACLQAVSPLQTFLGIVFLQRLITKDSL
jgi:hypothetical protein